MIYHTYGQILTDSERQAGVGIKHQYIPVCRILLLNVYVLRTNRCNGTSFFSGCGYRYKYLIVYVYQVYNTEHLPPIL